MKSDNAYNQGQVRFDTVKVYEFPVVIGDNPACREGCPIQLGGDPIWTSEVSVEEYESKRGTRLRGKALYIDVTDRAGMLLSKGYSLDQIVGAVMEVEEVKKSRSESLKLNNLEKIAMAVDSAGRTLRKIVRTPTKRDKPNAIQARMA